MQYFHLAFVSTAPSNIFQHLVDTYSGKPDNIFTYNDITEIYTVAYCVFISVLGNLYDLKIALKQSFKKKTSDNKCSLINVDAIF